MELGGHFLAVECKLAELPGTDALRGFRALAGMYGEEAIQSAFVASRTARPYLLASDPPVRATDVPALVDALPSG